MNKRKSRSNLKQQNKSSIEIKAKQLLTKRSLYKQFLKHKLIYLPNDQKQQLVNLNSSERINNDVMNSYIKEH